MKRLSLLIMLCFLCWTSSAFAAVTLNLPEGLQIVAVNGLNADIYKQAQLPNGLNQIAVRYEGEFGRSAHDAEILYSDVFVVIFKAAEATLAMKPLGIQKVSHLEKFNRSPRIRIVDQNGVAVATAVEKLQKDGFQLLRNYEQELVAFNRSSSPAAVRGSMNLPAPAAVPTPVQPGQQVKMTEQMLKYWYLQADEETRQRFREWINR